MAKPKKIDAKKNNTAVLRTVPTPWVHHRGQWRRAKLGYQRGDGTWLVQVTDRQWRVFNAAYESQEALQRTIKAAPEKGWIVVGAGAPSRYGTYGVYPVRAVFAPERGHWRWQTTAKGARSNWWTKASVHVGPPPANMKRQVFGLTMTMGLGDPYYFRTKAQAQAWVRLAQARAVKNIKASVLEVNAHAKRLLRGAKH